MRNRPEWLSNAVFYEIYPQSFLDTDGDGIGNINGITEKLRYIRNLGCNTKRSKTTTRSHLSVTGRRENPWHISALPGMRRFW